MCVFYNFLAQWSNLIRKFEDAKGVIQSSKSKKGRQYNGQK
jgi:hypothetical protein